jgi:hypothetical protein
VITATHVAASAGIIDRSKCIKALLPLTDADSEDYL